MQAGLPPADLVLELADCEAFVKMYDREGAGSLSLDDFMIATAPATFNSLRSFGLSDDSLSFSQEMHGLAGLSAEPSQAKVSAFITHIITSDSLFLTKIQVPMQRNLAISRGTAPVLQKDLIFREICEHGMSADHFDKRCLNAFLQANGVCFPAHLTEAFFRRFNFSKEDTISFV